MRQGVGEIALLEVTARRNIDDANVVLVFVFQSPFEATPYFVFTDSASQPNLHQSQIRIGGDSAIQAVRQCAAAGGNDRSHHAMPTGDIVCVERSIVAFSRKDAVIGNDPVARLSQVLMRVKAGIEERDRHAATGETFIGIHAERRGEHKSVLLKDGGMRIDLPLRPLK